MITVRQIERNWEGKAYDKLFAELIANRPEAWLRLGINVARPVPAAALAVIRLDELAQSHAKLYPRLIKAIVGAQEADGGWGDLVTTALCLRALLCGNGNGLAIDRGMAYVSGLQKSEGIWPNVPIRRMPADPYVSALILYQLGEHPRFRQAVRLQDAVCWFNGHQSWIGDEARELWHRAKTRCRLPAGEQLASLS